MSVWTKDGAVREAATPADEVELRFAGWTEKKSTSSTSSNTRKSTPRKRAARKSAAAQATSDKQDKPTE